MSWLARLQTALDRVAPIADTPKGKAFKVEYKARHGSEPAAVEGGLAYDSANMLIQVMRGALDEYGELTRESLYKYAREKIAAGEFRFTDNVVMKEYHFTPETEPDPVIGAGYWLLPIVQAMGGEFKIVWPPDLEQADIAIPPWLPTR